MIKEFRKDEELSMYRVKVIDGDEISGYWAKNEDMDELYSVLTDDEKCKQLKKKGYCWINNNKKSILTKGELPLSWEIISNITDDEMNDIVEDIESKHIVKKSNVKYFIGAALAIIGGAGLAYLNKD